MANDSWSELRELSATLNSITGVGNMPAPPARRRVQNADVIISHIEVCDRHGVGKLIRMMFQGEPDIVSIRSASYFGGRNEVGDLSLCISHQDTSRSAVFENVLRALGDTTIRRALCIPYFADDVRTAIALKEIFGIPLCAYIMDGQNVYSDGIPDALMKEFVEKSTLCLAISPEMCAAYERKYRRVFWYMPPLAPAQMIPRRLTMPRSAPDSREGVIIGNIWGEQWLNRLRETVRSSDVILTWYCNGRLPCAPESLIADSIIARDPLTDEPLVAALRESWFAVLPTGLLDDGDDRRFIAQLSLPSRIPYIMATSHTPILVLGSADTAAARFVRQSGIGLVAGYDRESFSNAVDRIMTPEVNVGMRKRALLASGRFADTGAAEWIWQSLARGEPIDGRFEEMASAGASDVSHRVHADLRCPTHNVSVWLSASGPGSQP